MKRVALITGASKGLGVVITRSLIREGYVVVMTASDYSALEAAAVSSSFPQDSYRLLKLDVRSKTDFEQGLQYCIDEFGSCDLLINNAAITPTTDVMAISPEEFSDVIEVNLRGTFLGCQVFGAAFEQWEKGRIVNLTSLAGQMGGTASGAHYAASKAGIITLTKIFAKRFAGKGVTVNAIAPGPVDVDSIREKLTPTDLENLINNAIPVKAMSNPAFIADMVVMLAREDANTVTGATWDINGGIYMR